MTQTTIKAAFIVDGKTFETKAAANEYIKAPLIKAQVLKLANGDEALATWLIGAKEQILDAFGSATIKRVTKQERKQLAKELKSIVEAKSADTTFIAENFQAILDSFRWPTVQRLSPEEKIAATKDAVLDLTPDNPAMADWLLANQKAVEDAFVIKQVVSEEQLAKLRAGAEKAREARNAAKAATEATVTETK